MLSRKVLRDVVARRRREVGCGWSLFKPSTVKRKGSRYCSLGSNILTKVAYYIVR